MSNGRATVHIFLLGGLKNALNVMVSSASLMDPTSVVQLDPTRRLTASRAPELHWQLALTCRGSPAKVIF